MTDHDILSGLVRLIPAGAVLAVIAWALICLALAAVPS